MTPEQKLVVIYGTKSAAARAFGVTYETMRVWCRDGLPLHKALEIEDKTRGEKNAITADEILKAAQKKRKNGHWKAA